MYFNQIHHQAIHKEDPKLTKLRQDNIQLENALRQLNQCYQEKISILEQQLKQSKQKEEALLEWKSSYIDKQLFNNAKYEQELEKLLTMIEQMTSNYQKDEAEFKAQLEQKDEEIVHLKDENAYLRQEKEAQQLKIETLAQKYIVEIERLNNQLKQLKEEVNSDYLTEKQGEQFEKEEEEQILKDSRETPFDEQSVQGETGEQSIIDQNFTEVQEKKFSVLREKNPLSDISNKNPLMMGFVEKSSFMNGAITIQSQFIH